MKSLQQALESLLQEGLLSSDYDVTDDDINPMRDFVAKYKSDYKSKGSYFIKSKWPIAEMEQLLRHYGQKVVNTDFLEIVLSARKNKETIVVVQPNSNFSIFIPQGKDKWVHYTCDPAFTTASLFKGFEYTEESLIDRSWVFQKAQIYVLKNNKFLKDIQRYLR